MSRRNHYTARRRLPYHTAHRHFPGGSSHRSDQTLQRRREMGQVVSTKSPGRQQESGWGLSLILVAPFVWKDRSGDRVVLDVA